MILTEQTLAQFEKTPNNHRCPCGSMRKYKKCCKPAADKMRQEIMEREATPPEPQKETKPPRRVGD